MSSADKPGSGSSTSPELRAAELAGAIHPASPASRDGRGEPSLDRTQELRSSDEEHTSLHAPALPPESVLPFRAPASQGSPAADPERTAMGVPMEESDSLDAETHRIRMHVLPFKNKPVPFEVKLGPPPPSPRPEPASSRAAAAPPSSSAARPAPASSASDTEERTALLDLPAEPEESTAVIAEPAPRGPAGAVTTGRGAAPLSETAPPASLLDIEGYAAYRAEISLYPDRVEQIRRRYELHGVASHERLDRYWRERLVREPALRERWESLCQRYASWLLLKQRG